MEAVFSGQYEYLLYGGAAGGGKSYVSLATLILLAKIFPGSKSHVIRVEHSVRENEWFDESDGGHGQWLIFAIREIANLLRSK